MFVRMLKRGYIYCVLPFDILNALCMLSHLNMLCTIVRTKDSIAGSNIILPLDYSPTSILA